MINYKSACIYGICVSAYLRRVSGKMLNVKCSGLATFCRAALSETFLRTKAAIEIS